MAKVITEPLCNPHRPGRAARAEQLIREFRIVFRGQGAVPELRAKTSFQVLAASVSIAPLGPAMHERVSQGDEAVGITEWRSSFVEWLGIGHDQGKLVLVQDWGPGHRGPEMCRNGQHATTSARVAVGHVILDLEVQLVDGCLEKGRGGEYGADHVGAMLPDNVRIRRTRVFLLDLAREVGHVPRREQMVSVQARCNLCRRFISGSLGRYRNRDIRVQ
jgi:hypothetical protein